MPLLIVLSSSTLVLLFNDVINMNVLASEEAKKGNKRKLLTYILFNWNMGSEENMFYALPYWSLSTSLM